MHVKPMREKPFIPFMPSRRAEKRGLFVIGNRVQPFITPFIADDEQSCHDRTRWTARG